MLGRSNIHAVARSYLAREWHMLHGCCFWPAWRLPSEPALVPVLVALSCQSKLAADIEHLLDTGYVRHTSSRFMPPELNNGSGDYTLGRPVPPPPEDDDKKKKYRGLRR